MRRDELANGNDFARGFMTEYQVFCGRSTSDASSRKVVRVAAADPSGDDSDEDAVRLENGHRYLFDIDDPFVPQHAGHVWRQVEVEHMLWLLLDQMMELRHGGSEVVSEETCCLTTSFLYHA